MSNETQEMIILYAHPCRIERLFYGEFLSATDGLCWTVDGKERGMGFEEGDFETMFAKKQSMVPDSNGRIELRRGEPRVWRSDMNPHGLI